MMTRTERIRMIAHSLLEGDKKVDKEDVKPLILTPDKFKNALIVTFCISIFKHGREALGSKLYIF